MSDGRGKSQGSLDALAANRRPQPQRLRPDGAVTHGAYAADVEALADEHAVRYRTRFEHEPDPELIRVQAVRLAMAERLETWLAEHGLLKGKPKGDPFGAANLLVRLLGAFETTHVRMLELDREAATGDPVARVRAHIEGARSKDD